ncbi:bifunctional 2',3'-cyclic-nucleotide 2'-phosphodiesterase/3'-nucleotidase [Microvirga brassicacearum]|uniref:Bifunctional 2',3'-cyclic-nucleotide 2'-phosphodiesterase/3'-nucleotidase n=1 Tax=Microvirga brassicacearum TaxID=2580413 RepID=A0A5N3P661_9HYPH|nr:bifunctional 2',3'-cyclic-nucleotide 2'-phosphodiesterase/3'-nucleotidase [Microvirga brassicacearum]KAB0265226.1 bifunctional 2',3'-cyclic-nucleotide 2'-phosphodiesterase/3'-nucleotidase [Microvirga brassicacearum]
MTTKFTRRRILQTGVAAAALTAVPQVGWAADPVVKLRILETTDLHVNILPYDYYRDAADDTVGLARTAAIVKAARSEAKNSLLFDNGDLIQGSPLGDFVAYRRGMKKGDVHPMVAAMNTLDYDCGTLGNHEFNYGLDFLQNSLGAAKFPLVCANVIKADGTTLQKPWLVLDRDVVDEAGATHKLKVGVIGFLPPQIVQWDKGHLDGKATTIDIVDAAEKHVPDMKKAGADIVVALCHSGIAGGDRKGGEENAALHLAKVDGIDVILTGHQHLTFPGGKEFSNIPGVDAKAGTLHGKPAVMAGFWGSHLGQVDLDLTKDGSRWKVAGFKTEARPIYDRVDRKVVPKVASEAAVIAAVQADHDATLKYVREPVGTTAVPIHSYYSLVADDASVKLVAEAQAWYVADLLKTTPHKDLPLLSAAAPFKAGGRGGPNYFTEIKKGPLAIKDMADIYIYPNTIRAVKVTGAQVREWLERSAGIYNQIDVAKGGEQDIINAKFPAYNFDVIAGVQYKIDPTQASRYDNDGKLVAPDAHRIKDLTYNGKAVADDQVFVVATNNYRAGGGGNFPGADGTTIILDAPDLTRDAIMRFIIERKEVSPKADGSWALVTPPANVTATFLTGPNAAGYQPSGIKVEKMGDAPEGFVKYRIVA